MKKILVLLIILISLSFTNVNAKEYKYVVDDGGLLNKDTEQYIESYSSYLYDISKIEYYVITINSLGEYDIDTYGDIVYENYVTNKKKDRGLLILLSKNDRRVKVIAGKGISNALTNEVIDKFIDDYFISFLSTNEWDSGIKNGYTAFYKFLCYHLDIDTSGLNVINGNDFVFKYRYYILFICIWICYIIGYTLPKYFIKLFNKNYKVNTKEQIIFYGSIFLNVIIIYYNSLLTKNSLYILLVVELFSILSSTVLNTNKQQVMNNNKVKKINEKRKKSKIKKHTK